MLLEYWSDVMVAKCRKMDYTTTSSLVKLQFLARMELVLSAVAKWSLMLFATNISCVVVKVHIFRYWRNHFPGHAMILFFHSHEVMKLLNFLVLRANYNWDCWESKDTSLERIIEFMLDFHKGLNSILILDIHQSYQFSLVVPSHLRCSNERHTNDTEVLGNFHNSESYTNILFFVTLPAWSFETESVESCGESDYGMDK